MMRILKSHATMYVTIVLLYLCCTVPHCPAYDRNGFDRLYAGYPDMTLDAINKGIDSLYRKAMTSPEPISFYQEVLPKVGVYSEAFARFNHFHSPYHAGEEELRLISIVQRRISGLATGLSQEYGRRFMHERMRDTADKYYATHKAVPLHANDPDWPVTEWLFQCLWFFWWTSWLFAPLVLFLRFEQVGKSMGYELLHRPHKVVLACMFLPLAIWGYPNDELRQDLVRAAKWMLNLATSALSFLLTFGSWALACGVAKAQNTSEGKKSQPITWVADYRSTDKVAGDGAGGLPNTLFVQLENVPRLPKRLVLESISAFGEKGYQTDAYAAVKTVSYKGLRVWPTAGVQFNTNGSRGFVYGTQMSYKRGRLAVAVPNIWFEHLVTPKPVDTFWVIARPLYNIRGAMSLCGEVNFKKSGQSPGVTTLGFGLDIKARWLRIKAIALWKSDGTWLMRKQAVASGVF